MRSMLFVPADSDRKLAKAFVSGADALILDLEDSVAVDRKPAGRAMARAFIETEKSRSQRPLLYVRINALDSPLWEDDLAAVMPAGPDGIMQPKTRSGEDVHRLSIALDHAETRSGGKPGATRIVPIVTEMPLSILQLPSYIGASSRMAAINWGMEDLSAEMGASTYRAPDGQLTSPFRLARDLTLFMALAAGVAPLDAVYPDFRDLAGLEQECKAAARDGFLGKAAIHPDQVAVINAAFTPAPEEIERALGIEQLFAESPGAGVISYKGQMLDRPHLIKAQRVLARARAAGAASA
jgi:citrate lyase subunit beta/citryl-CoA lyase